MLPRRTAVIRYASILFLLLLALTLYITGPDSVMRVPWRPLNETALRIEYAKLSALANLTHPHQGNMSASELYQYVQALKKSLPVNPHNFKQLINPSHICRGQEVFLLVYIHSAPDHFKYRSIIRSTWGNPKYYDVTVRLIFLLGAPASKVVQEAVEYESSQYQDILQENFHDSYKNLTYKAIMALKWISSHCSHAKFVLKTDDDIFVNMFNLINHFKSWSSHGRGTSKLLYCLVWTRMKVMRDPKSKWYISKEEFPDDFFPTYCSGSAYMFSTDVILDMYKASLETEFFWVDDFYITGMLAKKVGVVHQKFNSVYSLGPSTFLEKFSEEPRWRTLVFGHVHNMNHVLQVWGRILKERNEKGIS